MKLNGLLFKCWAYGICVSGVVALFLINSSGFGFHFFKKFPELAYFPYWLGKAMEQISDSLGVLGLFLGLCIEILTFFILVFAVIVGINRCIRKT